MIRLQGGPFFVLTFFSILFILNTNALLAQGFVKEKKIDSMTVFFDSGSGVVKSGPTLINFLNKINTTSGRIVLKAYTDTVGELGYNQQLASKRLINVCSIIGKTSKRSFKIDSVNVNENYAANGKTNQYYRRVDILVYEFEIELNKSVSLNIIFEGGTANVLRTSTETLRQLNDILEADKTLKVKFNGHVCCGADQELSLKRAQTVQNYLVENGINASRITCQGFSNTRPLFPENSPENEEKNRRVEVVFSKL